MTRYPNDKKGTKWTIRGLLAIPAEWKGDTLSDTEGLSGDVRVNKEAVSVSFRYGFKWEGKKAWFYCGSWPAVDLAEIRQRRDGAKKQVANGINPNDKKQADKIESQQAVEATIATAKKDAANNKTVADLFDAWVINGTAYKDQGKSLRQRFTKDVIPEIGTMPVKAVTPDDIRALLRKMVSRGVNRSAIVMLADIQQMFRWGSDEQPWRRLLIEGDPSKRIKPETIVDPDYDLSNERNRVLVPDELRELRDIFAGMEKAYQAAPDKRVATRPVQAETQLALWIALSTMCRIGEILKAEWQHVDLTKGEWVIPKTNYKRGRGDKRGDYLVLLSPFALAQFKALKAITGDSEWCFPAKNKDGYVSDKSVSKQVGDRQFKYKQRSALKNRRNDNSLVLTSGVKMEWTPHDLRRTGSTMMQKLGVSNDVRNLCLNHSIGTKIDRTYGVHDFYDEKREAWAKLGDQLQTILQ